MKFYIQSVVIEKIKKLDVKIRKSFRKKIDIFAKNPYDSSLDNHLLKKTGRKYTGYRSIDITNDNKFVALYKEVQEGEETVAYFFEVGFKKELYNEKKF